MELMSILHVLYRHRILVALGALAAVVAGLASVLSQPEASTRGLAHAKLFVDTRNSYASDLAGGTEALGLQAALLGALVADDRQRRAIAAQAGVTPDSVEVLVSGITEPKTPSTLTRTVSSRLGPGQRPNSVVVRLNTAIAIVGIEASAPTAATAARLAGAAADRLRAVTAQNAPTPRRSLVIKQLGSVQALTVDDSRLPAPLLGAVVAIMLFALTCATIVFAAGLARAWRGVVRLTAAP